MNTQVYVTTAYVCETVTRGVKEAEKKWGIEINDHIKLKTQKLYLITINCQTAEDLGNKTNMIVEYSKGMHQ